MPHFVAPGTLLLAWPGMSDANFARAVVLLCQHDQRGAYGLVLNRRERRRVKDLVEPGHVLSGVPQPVHIGGPVDLGRVQFVHALPASVPDGVAVGQDLILGGDVERLVALVTAAPDALELPVRFFLGYSGWGAGQLEAELAGGSWYPLAGGARRVFDSNDPAAWDRWIHEHRSRLALGRWSEAPCEN